MKLNDDKMYPDELSHFYESSKITASKYAAGINTSLLKKLIRDISSRSPHSDGLIGSTIFDTLVVLAFFEFYLQYIMLYFHLLQESLFLLATCICLMI